MSERWVVIAEFPAYSVSDVGRVRRDTPGRRVPAGTILTLSPNELGYHRVELWKDGGRKCRRAR